MAKAKKKSENTKSTKSIAEVVDLFNKGNKDTQIILVDGDFDKDIPVISYGSLKVDRASGVGGMPQGRLIEVFGPESSGKTTLTLMAAAAAQKAGGKVAFVDAEHALSPKYAANLGVNVKELLITQPDSGEQALDAVESLTGILGSGDLIIVDSVAALTPRNEIDGDMGDHHVGAQARLMSQACRKLTGLASKQGVTIMFINQIRMKIGVMFGCFHYDARVLLADGSTEKIGKIVNNKMEVEVLSKSKEGKLEPKKIIDWHDNGKAGKFYNLVVEYPHGSGRSYLPIGDDHTIFTPKGERLASTLKVGDKVLVKSKSYLTDEQMEMAVGTFLGDGSLRINDAENTSSIRLGHGVKQKQYLRYKARFLGDNFMGNEYSTGNNGIGCDSAYTNELVWLSKYKHFSALRFIGEDLLKKITIRSMCIWYLDDGTFSGSYKKWGWGKSEICASKLDVESKHKIAHHCMNLGLPIPTVTERGFLFSGTRNKAFHEAIAKYTPRCMEYKIHPKFRIACDDTTGERLNKIKNILIPAKIVDIYDKPNSKATHKFDITVEDNHSYFIDNVLVHNSPETTTGGNALKFYTSQRIDVRRIGSKKNNKDVIILNKTRIKFVKNKVAPPFREAETQIRFGEGIPRYWEILDMASELNLIEQSGNWYKYKGEMIGQGEEKACEYLKENPKLMDELEALIRKEYQI